MGGRQRCLFLQSGSGVMRIVGVFLGVLGRRVSRETDETADVSLLWYASLFRLVGRKPPKVDSYGHHPQHATQ